MIPVTHPNNYCELTKAVIGCHVYVLPQKTPIQHLGIGVSQTSLIDANLHGKKKL